MPKSELDTRLLGEIRKLVGGGFEVPPKVFRDMEGSFVAYEPGRSLRVRFPLFERYEGPGGFIQGGIVTAAFDNAYGPFSYLAARAFTTTVHISTSFVRPLQRADEAVEVEVFLVEKTRRMVFMDGRAYSAASAKLVATNHTELLIVPLDG